MSTPLRPLHCGEGLEAHAGRELQASCQFFHFRRCCFLALGNSGIDGLKEQFLEEFRIGRVNDGRIYGQFRKIAVAGGGNFQFSAGSFRSNGLRGKLFLSCCKSGLHLLNLLHHFHYVHGRCVWVVS